MALGAEAFKTWAEGLAILGEQILCDQSSPWLPNLPKRFSTSDTALGSSLKKLSVLFQTQRLVDWMRGIRRKV